MSTVYESKKVKVKALHDWVIVSDINFGEKITSSGIVLKSDNGKAHGVYPRWGKVYAVGPDQQEIKIGQWILIEHGRWTRGIKIQDESGEKLIQKVDLNGIIAISDNEPSTEDQIYENSI